MFRPLVLSAAVAGLVGGLVVAAYQMMIVTPLIVEAEVYEIAVLEMGQHLSVSTHGHAAADPASPVVSPASLPRQAMTAMATIVYAAGASLILLGLMALAGRPISARATLNWGLAGFAAVAIAPAVGLPPELPGMAAADVMDRQIWLIGTVVATGAGLWAIFRGAPVWIAFGVALVLVPHLVGAPQLVGDHDTAVPAALAAHFVAVSLAGSLIFWTVGPAVAGFAFARLKRTEDREQVRR